MKKICNPRKRRTGGKEKERGNNERERDVYLNYEYI